MRQDSILLKKIICVSGCCFLTLAAGCPGMALAMEQESEAESEYEADAKREYIFPESAGQYIAEEELKDLPAQLLAYGRYEIYARHGMLFESEELSGFFGSQSWYFGFIDEDSFPAEMLNEYETENVRILEEAELASESGRYVTDQEHFSYDLIEACLAGEDLSQWKIQSGAVPESEEETETESEAETKEETETESEAETKEETEAETKASAPVIRESERKEQTETEAKKDVGQLSLDGKNEDLQNVNIMGEAAASSGSNSVGMAEAGSAVVQPQSPSAGVTTGSEYIFPDVAVRLLTRAEVDALSLQAACYAKNEIYARHGRMFASKELQDYFQSKSWYMGIISPEEFSDMVFNEYEKQNLLLIVERENTLAPEGYQLDQPGYDITKVNTASRAS